MGYNPALGIFIIGLFVLFAIFLIIAIPSFKKEKKKIEGSIEASLLPNEKIVKKQDLGVSYLGGHPPFGPEIKNGGLMVTNMRIVFYNIVANKTFSIFYRDMIDVSMETKQSLTATRIALAGLLAPIWKKNKPFLLLKINNEIGETSNVGFGFAEPGLGSPFWSTNQWFQLISENRYELIKSKIGDKGEAK